MRGLKGLEVIEFDRVGYDTKYSILNFYSKGNLIAYIDDVPFSEAKAILKSVTVDGWLDLTLYESRITYSI